MIRFRFNLGARGNGGSGQSTVFGDSDVSLPRVDVSDGAWHSVHVSRHGQWAALSLDHGEGFFSNQTLPVASTAGAPVTFRVSQGGLFAGGDVRFPSATSSPLVTHDFVDGESFSEFSRRNHPEFMTLT